MRDELAGGDYYQDRSQREVAGGPIGLSGNLDWSRFLIGSEVPAPGAGGLRISGLHCALCLQSRGNKADHYGLIFFGWNSLGVLR
jgi:hypothetical protein